jgi:NitT/TauT family transport system substrate-binding protein
MEKTQKKALSFLIVSFLLGWLAGGEVFLAAAAESPAPQALKKVVIGYSAISPSQAPAWIAHEAGIFRKYGLDVQLIFVESGSRTVQTLISGDVVAAQVAGPSVIQSNLQLWRHLIVDPEQLDYKPTFTGLTAGSLKGKVVAVSRIGSSSDFAGAALEKWSLIPTGTSPSTGSQPLVLRAGNGEIHGVMIVFRWPKHKIYTLADCRCRRVSTHRVGGNAKYDQDTAGLVRSALKL